MIVKAGQVWEDNDARIKPGAYRRRFEVLEVGKDKATVITLNGAPRKTKIKLDRFKPTPTGYRLIEEPKKPESKCPSCEQPRGDQVECPSCHKIKLTCCGIAGKHVRCFECEET